MYCLGGNMTKILILEDDDFIRQQLAGILQEKDI